VRILFWIILGLGLVGALTAARADTLQLIDGSSVSGDIVLFNEGGITLRTPSDSYTNVVWPKFSQDALKQLSENPRIKPFAALFIETPPVRAKSEEIKVQVSRLVLPPKQSLLAALLSSSVGFVALLLILAANVYAAYEIAIVRSRPIGQLMGVAAVLPILGPVIYLCLPVRREAGPSDESSPEAHSFSVPGGAAPAAESLVAGGVHVASAGAGRGTAPPEAQIFQRGQFMFNRRFFETKFSGFFSTIRRPAERDLVLVVKTARTALVVQRITRIATNEAHFEILQGTARQEVMVPFADIQEIQIKHKDA
jgi:hypothetical protein